MMRAGIALDAAGAAAIFLVVWLYYR